MSEEKKQGEPALEQEKIPEENQAELVTESREMEIPQVQVKITDAAPDLSTVEVKNPRIGKVLKLQEEVERQNELEQLRSKRIRQEQEYIDKMLQSVEENLKNTKEEQKINEEFEAHIRTEIYRMHGISEDKLQGMTERKTAWYQGAAFSLFFLSIVMIVLCGLLHGFGSELCIFMAFYTAIEGTLLSNGRKQSVILEGLIKVLYLLLFPVMMVVFVCYELGFEEYQILVPIFVIAGVAVLILGAISYFLYDPYRVDRRNKKKAQNYIKEMEKTALKEVRLKEKKLEKLEKKRKKETEKTEKEQLREKERKEKRQQFKNWWQEHKPFRKTETESESEKQTVKECEEKE
ncbi:MAG: hypothetical protein PUA75_01095 [Clostridiales bacterium]|nr:hypothetical protein [Clostridiales bacterium]